MIGLTGGLASGKSAAATHFAQLGAGVIDADRITRDLVTPGSPALAGIRQRFGKQVLQADGSLDRAALARLVFADDDARRDLEALLHPLVRAAMQRRLAELRTPYAILVVPLLIESGMTDLVDRVLVIDAPESLQRNRSRARDGHHDELISQILAAQADRETRLAAADDVIRNDGDMATLLSAVEHLHQSYLALAQQP